MLLYLKQHLRNWFHRCTVCGTRVEVGVDVKIEFEALIKKYGDSDAL
jgi:hypothetical protein